MIELKDAIEIARILSKVPEERMKLVLSVFDNAGLTIDGLEELEVRIVCRDRNTIVDFKDFMGKVGERFADSFDGTCYTIPTSMFTEFCGDLELDPRAARAWLARKGCLKTCTEKDKVNYTVTRSIDGKAVRCVVLKKNPDGGKNEAAEETNARTENTDRKDEVGLEGMDGQG